MDNLNKICEDLKKQEQLLQKLIQKLDNRQRTAIPGALIVCGSEKKKDFYFREASRKPLEYLSKKRQAKLINTLAQQEYERKLLSAAEAQLTSVRQASRILTGKELEEVYSHMIPARQELVKPFFPDRERFIRDWCAVTYPPGHFDEDAPEYYSGRGERVRSKSEKIIADKYLRLDQPYRYEYPILLIDGNNRVVFRPDFTLLNKRTCKVYYHQHLGRMDDPAYVADNLRKLRVFEENGIYLGVNLFFTYETNQDPFDDRTLDKHIKRYLL